MTTEQAWHESRSRVATASWTWRFRIENSADLKGNHGNNAAALDDGHRRKPGVAAANDTRRWRHLRRSARRWLSEIVEGW